MKLNKIILPVMACALTLSGCYDEKMEWGKPDGHGDVNISDIPLALKEKLANYDYIKAYAKQTSTLAIHNTSRWLTITSSCLQLAML